MRTNRIIPIGEQEFIKGYNPKDYERPSLTADIIILKMIDDKLNVLLIKRGGHPFKEYWAIPGGFVGIDEDCATAAYRELKEETGVEDVYLEQLYTFSEPLRDPRMRVISTAYIALVSDANTPVTAGDDATEAKWFEVNPLLEELEKKDILAFDHEDILRLAIERIRGKLHYTNVAFQLVGDTFTFRQLQMVYEQVLNQSVYVSNLKRELNHRILPTGTLSKTKGRPAEVYRENKKYVSQIGGQTNE